MLGLLSDDPLPAIVRGSEGVDDALRAVGVRSRRPFLYHVAPCVECQPEFKFTDKGIVDTERPAALARRGKGGWITGSAGPLLAHWMACAILFSILITHRPWHSRTEMQNPILDRTSVDEKQGAVQAWYALYTKPHCERQVASALEAKGMETYFPAIPVAVPRAGVLPSGPSSPVTCLRTLISMRSAYRP